MNEEVVVIADRAGVIRYWSAGAEKRFGWSRSQTVGATLDMLVPAAFRDAHWNGFRRAAESGTANLEGLVNPFPVVRADGNIQEVDGRLTLVRDPAGRVAAVTVVFTEIDAV